MSSLTANLNVLARYELPRKHGQFDRAYFRAHCPESPGVYIMHDNRGVPVYVGRSRKLRTRLNTYFRCKDLQDKASLIMNATHAISWEVLPDEFGCRLREIELIQELKPRYNVQFHPLRKRRAYLYLSRESAPRFVASPTTPEEGDCLAAVGPLPSLRRLMQAATLLNDHFKLRICSEDTLRGGSKAQRQIAACLRPHLRLCTAPCKTSFDAMAYEESVRRGQDFLGGRSQALIRELKSHMQTLADNLAFERAALVRDQLTLLLWVRKRMREIRRMRRTFHFIYPAVSSSGHPHWYAVKGGQVVFLAPAPQTAAERSIFVKKIEAVFFGSHSTPVDSPWADSLAGYNLASVAQWFRQHPEELKRVLTPKSALQQLYVDTPPQRSMAFCAGAPLVLNNA